MEMYLEKENPLKMLIESFEIYPAKITSFAVIPPNINTDDRINSLIENIIRQTKVKEPVDQDHFEVFNCSQGSDEKNQHIITEETLANIDLSKILIETNGHQINENPFINENSIASEEKIKSERIDDNSNKLIEEYSNNIGIGQQDINAFYNIFQNNNNISNKEEFDEKM